jgi:hypothetical protein
VTDDQNDLMTDANLAANLCHRMNDLLGGQNSDVMTDASRGLHMNDLLDDLNLGAMTSVNLCHRKNDLMGDRMTDENRDRRKNVTDDRCDRNLDVDHHDDLMMDANLDVMNHHVKKMVFLNMSCDQMSRDHLRYDHQMMRHRDMNRMDGMNLDAKNRDAKTNLKIYPMRLHHESRLMTVWMMRI